MLTRRTFATVAAFAVVATMPALAAATKYTPDALAMAQKSGKPVLVEVSAPWCPTCRAQKAVFAELDKLSKYKEVQKIEIDFDSQKDALKALNAKMQSTLIMFKGDKEVGRLVGDAKRESIEALLTKGL